MYTLNQRLDLCQGYVRGRFQVLGCLLVSRLEELRFDSLSAHRAGNRTALGTPKDHRGRDEGGGRVGREQRNLGCDIGGGAS